MKAEKVRPQQRNFFAAVGACTAARRGDKVAELLEEMARDGVRTSEGARALVKKDCEERVASGDEDFARALEALDVLNAAAPPAVPKSAVEEG